MADPKYPVPEDPAYRARNIRAIQDEDPVSASGVVNPVVEAVLESMEYLNQHKAELDETGKVPESQLPALGGHTVQEVEPNNQNLLWVDTSDGNILKFYDASTQAWVPVGAVWS